MGTVFKALDKSSPRDISIDDENDISIDEETIRAQSEEHSEHRTSGNTIGPLSPLAEKPGSEIDPSLAPSRSVREADESMNGWDERLIEVVTSSPLVREGIRRLRNKILHPSDNRRIKSVLLTSAVPGEGKSFICANLGVSLAQGVEKHAILVDCDLRRPTLASLFGVEKDMGLADYLIDNKDLSQLIKKTGQQKLSIIPSGPPPTNPAEIVDSQKMVSAINELSGRYPDRIVLIDSPPMLAATETSILADLVDGVILVVRWGLSGRQQVKEIVDTIGKEKIIGIVFNAFQMNMLEKNVQKMKGYEGYYKYASGY